MKLRTILWRSWRLRCPACGEEKLFRDWLRLRPACEQCGLSFDREPGFYLGSIYVNYGLTAILVTIGYFSLYFTEAVSPDEALWICLAFCLVFPLCFFRYARSLWLGLDYYFDPKAARREPPQGGRRL
ncbi:MAG TPA: DUF983 domain-containing protein [Pirellulales bacterium]|jgi:uncharacterized protein (DUF983 family)|nr:DUF983 domain-containing protein [Pirellulales bacterium]